MLIRDEGRKIINSNIGWLPEFDSPNSDKKKPKKNIANKLVIKDISNKSIANKYSII